MDEQQEVKQGISLFKIDYEIQGQDSIWSAGIVAYSSEEAVKSLAKFLRETIKDFKGFKIDTLAFQGQVHHLSEQVREKIMQSAQVVTQEELQAEAKPKKKKSVLKKDEK